MKHSALIMSMVVLTSIPASAGENVVNWVKVTDHAGWQPRDSQGEVVYRNRLWIFGGWFNTTDAPPRDVWSSMNGKTWTLIEQKAPWKHSDLSMSVVFKDRMWFMGGWHDGRLPSHSASNQVWSSTDGVSWEQITDDAGWSPRIAAALVEFRGKMWLLGGTENYYFGDENSTKNDVWTSSDGNKWMLATDNAGWSPRAYHQALVLNDRIYIFGGGDYRPKYHALNDVWSSADGIHWRQETASAPWHPRIWFSSVVYRDRMWVIGGWSDKPFANWNDTWYSRNGRDWKQLKSDVVWKQRHEHSGFVFQDKIWIAGGHAIPLNSEVWSLQIPENWFEDD